MNEENSKMKLKLQNYEERHAARRRRKGFLAALIWRTAISAVVGIVIGVASFMVEAPMFGDELYTLWERVQHGLATGFLFAFCVWMFSWAEGNGYSEYYP